MHKLIEKEYLKLKNDLIIIINGHCANSFSSGKIFSKKTYNFILKNDDKIVKLRVIMDLDKKTVFLSNIDSLKPLEQATIYGLATLDIMDLIDVLRNIELGNMIPQSEFKLPLFNMKGEGEYERRRRI